MPELVTGDSAGDDAGGVAGAACDAWQGEVHEDVLPTASPAYG